MDLRQVVRAVVGAREVGMKLEVHLRFDEFISQPAAHTLFEGTTDKPTCMYMHNVARFESFVQS